MGEKAVDSTKGNALADPRTYKGDVLVQCWIDARKLAMLSVWLDNGGRVTRYMSEVIRFVMEEVVDHLIESGEIEKIEFCDEARELLTRKYRSQLNPSGRGAMNFKSNLILDNRRKSGYNEKGMEPIINEDYKDTSAKESKSEEHMRIYNEIVRKEKEEARRLEKERNMKNIEIDADGFVKIAPSNIGSITDEDIEKWKSNDNISVVNEVVERKIGVTGNIQLRKKSDAELELEGERIAKKDAELAKQMNEMPARRNVVKVDD